MIINASDKSAHSNLKIMLANVKYIIQANIVTI